MPIPFSTTLHVRDNCLCLHAQRAARALARRFDVSPAWQAWIGAEQSIGMFAELDIAEIWDRAAGLGELLCAELGLPAQRQAIVSWPDPDGTQLAAMAAAGIRISGRAGRARASFHLWNTEEDVEQIVTAVRGMGAAHDR